MLWVQTKFGKVSASRRHFFAAGVFDDGYRERNF